MGNPLPNLDLNAISEELSILRPDTARVMRRAEGVDYGGAPLEEWVEIASYGCRVERPGRQGREGITGGAMSSAADYVVVLPRWAEVTPDHQLWVTGQAFGGERHLEVVTPPDMETFYAELSVDCKLVR